MSSLQVNVDDHYSSLCHIDESMKRCVCHCYARWRFTTLTKFYENKGVTDHWLVIGIDAVGDILKALPAFRDTRTKNTNHIHHYISLHARTYTYKSCKKRHAKPFKVHENQMKCFCWALHLTCADPFTLFCHMCHRQLSTSYLTFFFVTMSWAPAIVDESKDFNISGV